MIIADPGTSEGPAESSLGLSGYSDEDLMEEELFLVASQKT